jgi:hypothetical protein
MSSAARTLLIWSVYLSVLAAWLLFAPNEFLALFRFPPLEEDVWIRIIGMFLTVLAYFSYQSARSENTDYFHWSVHVRATVILFFGAFVMLNGAPPILLLFGLVDLAAAIWTWRALRRDAARQIPSPIQPKAASGA